MVKPYDWLLFAVGFVVMFLLAEFVWSNLRMDSMTRRIKALEEGKALLSRPTPQLSQDWVHQRPIDPKENCVTCGCNLSRSASFYRLPWGDRCISCQRWVDKGPSPGLESGPS